MKTKMLAMSIGLLLLSLILVDGTFSSRTGGVDYDPSDKSGQFATAEMMPEEVTAAFYNWYIGYSKNQGNPLISEVYRSLVDGAYDPVLCARDFPEKIVVGGQVVSGQDAWVVVQTHWADGTTVQEATVSLKRMDGVWKVAHVICPPPDDAETASWQLYRDQEYRFQIRYPDHWTVQEVEVGDPEGNTSIERVLGFSPQGWEGAAAPVVIEVSAGSSQELQSIYLSKIAGRGTTTIINGYTVFVGESVYREVFYVFEHPTVSSLRVAIRERVGSTDRTDGLQASELREVVNQMISTFRFREQF
jgi:hypothetical protein